jgi:asparagine synthase (glutamine-hydrolysing)
MLAYDWKFTLADADLPKVTGTTRLAGVAVGFPLLSDALLDFSLTLPATWKVRGLTLRWFFKEALKGFLPDDIIRKKKHGFGLPFGPWLMRHADLHSHAQAAVRGLVARGLVRPEFADELFSSHLAEHPGYYGEMVWILMMLEHWLSSNAPGFGTRDG